jgi:biofilm PGA synthesis lipoprotein PgaB
MLRRVALAILLIASFSIPPASANDFIVLCYHEVRQDVRDYPDAYAVDGAALVQQFAWLRGSGYTPVSLQDIVASRQGGKPLPPKAVLLSFDDAYLSFYTHVFPLLREFRYPAVLGVVGKWIDNPKGLPVAYGEKGSVAQASFPSWDQVREMTASGLVEVASHSYDLHYGIVANPQGNLQPAATARLYDPATGRYEDDATWRARVYADLAQSASRIERETGRRPRAIVWPYGSYNGELLAIARELGMTVALTLEDGINTPDVPLAAVRRILVAHNPNLAAFTAGVRGPLRPLPVRVVQLSLDTIYDADPAQQERRLSVLLDRIKALKPSHVYLEALTDTDGDGVADATYFPNSGLPMRADLFNRVAWQLASRGDVKVFAVLAPAAARLTQAQLSGLHEDLARHANFDGLAPGGDDGLVAATRRWRGLTTLRGPVVMLEGDGVQIARRMRELQLGGTLDFGYRGDDATRDLPRFDVVAPAMSLRTDPR